MMMSLTKYVFIKMCLVLVLKVMAVTIFIILVRVTVPRFKLESISKIRLIVYYCLDFCCYCRVLCLFLISVMGH